MGSLEIIVGKSKKKPDEEEPAGSDPEMAGEDSDFVDAFAEFKAALKSGDDEEGATAFKNLISMCGG